ncbi:Calmodulin-binding protein 60 D, partial [Mucuna pruriens]
MESKWQSCQRHQGRGKVPIQELKQIYGDTKQASISGLGNVINALSRSDHSSYLETFLRSVVRNDSVYYLDVPITSQPSTSSNVREVVEQKIQGQTHLFSRKSHEAGISGAKALKLCFTNKMPDTIFTRSHIIAENELPFQIALFDVRTQSVVNDGPLSSLKIEICVLGGEFGSCDNDDWTEDEFNSNIVREREGKGPLLIGDRFITLKNGVGCIPNIAFSDNSRWQRSRRFRIGAKVVQPTYGEKIQEAYKKNYPPSLNDEVWRLEKIAKEGIYHKNLSAHGIHNVKDLLRLYITNEPSLYKMFEKIPKKSWLAITGHAKTCVIDDYKLYSYYSEELQIGLLFNSIYILVGVTSDWLNYYSPDTLTSREKYLVEIVKQHAYKNVDNLKLIDDTKLNCLNLTAFLKTRLSDTPDQVTSPGYSQPFISASYTDGGMHDHHQVYADPLPSLREMPQNSHAFDELFSGMYTEGDSWHLNESQFPFVENGYSPENVSSEIQFINDCPHTTWEPETSFYFGSSVGAEFSNGKPKAVWYKIRVALKWVISVKRYAAARKNALHSYFFSFFNFYFTKEMFKMGLPVNIWFISDRKKQQGTCNDATMQQI